MCTLDAESECSEEPHAFARFPLEIKNVNQFAADEWKEGPPEHYLMQAHQQMLITDASMCSVAALIGGCRLVWQDVERDEGVISRIIEAGEAFWDLVQTKTEPEIDGHDATKRALLRAYPGDDGNTVAMTREDEERVGSWQALKAAQRSLKPKISLLENQIKRAIGNKTHGSLPCGDSVTWKTQDTKSGATRVLRFKKGK